MGLEKIIGIDAYGGDAVNGIPPEARIAPAVAEAAALHPEFSFLIASPSYDVLTGYCDMPENVNVFRADPDKRCGMLRALTSLVEDKQIGGFYTLANTQILLPVVDNYIGTVDELGIVFNGKSRPPLLAEVPKFPEVNRVRSWYVLDVGAIPRLTKPEQFLMYAKIGSLYAQLIGGRENPAVGLASMGREPGKGDDLQKEAYKLFQKAVPNFTGNVEPHCRTHDYDIEKVDHKRLIDLVVQDGTGGNEYIKVFADGAKFTAAWLKEEIKHASLLEKFYAGRLRKLFDRMKKRIEPGQYGGAPLIGIKAPVFKGHGTTMENGILVGIEKYIRYVEHNFIQRMREELAKPIAYAR